MADAGTGAAMAAMAAASITVATINSAAATHAADIQVASADRTADLIDARFQLMRTDFTRYRAVGDTAVQALSDRLPEFVSTGNPYQAELDAAMPAMPAELTQAVLEATPGYQFTLAQGLRATQNAMAARGLGVSGAALRAIVTFATGLADQTFNTRFGQQVTLFNLEQQRFANVGMRFTWDQGLLTNGFNRLNNVVTLGQNSAAQVGKAGMDSANAVGAAIQAGANGAAAGVLAGAAATAGGINGLANAYSSFQQQKAYGLDGGSSSYKDAGGQAVKASDFTTGSDGVITTTAMGY